MTQNTARILSGLAGISRARVERGRIMSTPAETLWAAQNLTTDIWGSFSEVPRRMDADPILESSLPQFSFRHKLERSFNVAFRNET